MIDINQIPHQYQFTYLLAKQDVDEAINDISSTEYITKNVSILSDKIKHYKKCIFNLKQLESKVLN
jgi:hypothetical protein